MMKYRLIGILLASFFVFPVPVSAQIRQTAPTRTKIEFPEFVAGDNKTIDNPVNKDLMMAGGNVSVNADVAGDAYVAGGQVNIKGNVSGNLIVAGGTVNLSGKVAKNLIMAGGQLNMEESAGVGGYVLGAGDKLSLNGDYTGPVKIAGNELTMSDGASVGGNLEADVAKASIATGAIISGERKINIHEVKKPDTEKVTKAIWGWWETVSFLGKLLVTLVLVKLFGRLIKPAGEALSRFWSTLGWGLVALIVTPVLAMILLTTVVGIPLAMITLVLYMLAMYLSGAIVAIALGRWIADKGWLKNDNKYIQAIAGLLVITVIGLVPVLGGWVKFVVLLTGLGIVYRLATAKQSEAVVKTKK